MRHRTAGAAQALIIRTGKVEDFDGVTEFYADHHHRDIERRHAEVYWNCIQNERVYLIVDEENRICGSSITIDYPAMKYAELGATRIIGPRGFGLYEYLLTTQMLQLFFFRPPLLCPVANVNRSNRTVIARLQNNLGWEEFDPPAELTSVNDAMILERHEAVQWFACPVKALGRCAARMNSMSHGLILENGSGDQVSLQCESLRVVTEFGHLLTRLPEFAGLHESQKGLNWAAARNEMVSAYGCDRHLRRQS